LNVLICLGMSPTEWMKLTRDGLLLTDASGSSQRHCYKKSMETVAMNSGMRQYPNYETDVVIYGNLYLSNLFCRCLYLYF